jgi:hypothetical protein
MLLFICMKAEIETIYIFPRAFPRINILAMQDDTISMVNLVRMLQY